jgi:NADH:ubiquinone oxidoreductase subunit
MLRHIKRALTWWEGASVGTLLWTKRVGTEVGRDEAGNVYYRNADDSRRWVIYAGDNDASRVDAAWYGWLHHSFPKTPIEEPIARKTWEKPHQHNLTGGEGAFFRKGSIRRADVEPRSDYEAWTPK